MAMPMSASLQRRAVVDAVAGHRHDVAACLQGPGDAQLVLRRDPGDDDAVAVEQRAEQLLVRRAGRRLRATSAVRAEQPDLARRWPARSPGGRR